MRFIKFTQDRKTVEAEPQEFKAGRVYQLRDDSCDRWIKRAAAVEASEAEFKAQAKADAVAKKADAGAKAKVGVQAPAQTPNTTPAAETGMAAGPADDATSSAGSSDRGDDTRAGAAGDDTQPVGEG